MPGILLLPGGLNEKVIEKITADELWQRRDRPVLNSLAPKRARTQDPRVLLCHDGFGKNSERDAKWQTTFLKRLLGEKTDVRTFSFYDNDADFRLVEHCDYFYLAGGHEPQMTALFKIYNLQFQYLRTLILTRHVFYIGGCGGAMAAGRFWTPPTGENIEMLNLFQDVDV